MNCIDYKEISMGNIANGEQDTFELFARDFFYELGFRIIEGPDRGQDGGRDLIIEEERKGYIDCSKIRWLVSCKHYAHSKKSVGENDEVNIYDRVIKHNCQGFIGFYSTIASSGLTSSLESLKKHNIEYKIMDGKYIEREIIGKNLGQLMKRYFPISYSRWANNAIPKIIYSKYEPLKCAICGRDLLQEEDSTDKPGKIIVFVVDDTDNIEVYSKIYTVCKGNCDRIAQEKIANNKSTEWADIGDLIIPNGFLKIMMALVNGLRENSIKFTDSAFSEYKEILLKIAQVALREPTDKERERIDSLNQLPD